MGACFLVMVKRIFIIDSIATSIFQNAATGFIWGECQVSLGAGETIMAKLWSKIGFRRWLLLKSLICTVIMELSLLICSVMIAKQSISLRIPLELPAKQQNAMTKSVIQTIMYMAKTFTVHDSLH